jgi:hypothetical protein
MQRILLRLPALIDNRVIYLMADAIKSMLGNKKVACDDS